MSEVVKILEIRMLAEQILYLQGKNSPSSNNTDLIEVTKKAYCRLVNSLVSEESE